VGGEDLAADAFAEDVADQFDEMRLIIDDEDPRLCGRLGGLGDGGFYWEHGAFQQMAVRRPEKQRRAGLAG
jgi:hypothetical protein